PQGDEVGWALALPVFLAQGRVGGAPALPGGARSLRCAAATASARAASAARGDDRRDGECECGQYGARDAPPVYCYHWLSSPRAWTLIRSLRHCECLIRPPGDAHPAPRGDARPFGVLPADHQLATGVQAHHVAGEDSRIDHVADPAGLDVRARRLRLAVLDQHELLRPHGDRVAVPLYQ